MSDYMIQKADDQIEAGIKQQEANRTKKTIKRIYNSKIKCDCCLENNKDMERRVGFLRGISYYFYVCDDCESHHQRGGLKRGDY